MTMSRLTSVALAAALFALAGCGSSSSGGGNGGGNGGNGGNTKPAGTTEAARCEFSRSNFCLEFPTSSIKNTQDAQAIAQECQGQGGTFSYGGCAVEKHVGTCLITSEGVQMKLRFYSPVTANQAQAGCQQQGGTFATAY